MTDNTTKGRGVTDPVQTVPPVIEELPFDIATDFLAALHPTHPRWQGRRPGAWIFRGHRDADWTLDPNAFRPNAWEKFFPSFPAHLLPDKTRANHELLFLRLFAEALDRNGLPVPGGISTIERLGRELEPAANWPSQYIELAALAQHHALPTRLLDFSRHAYVAAYFAASDFESRAPQLCVWALDSSFLLNGERLDGPWFHLVTAARATNPNLHAQSGVFVAWTNRVSPLEQIVQDFMNGELPLKPGQISVATPILVKLTLPGEHADHLLQLLAFERITGATMFPGVDGVVRELRERKFYQGPNA